MPLQVPGEARSLGAESDFMHAHDAGPGVIACPLISRKDRLDRRSPVGFIEGCQNKVPGQELAVGFALDALELDERVKNQFQVAP